MCIHLSLSLYIYIYIYMYTTYICWVKGTVARDAAASNRSAGDRLSNVIKYSKPMLIYIHM